jgi:hypothetical protein
MTKPSSHLSWSELACTDGTVYPSRWRKSRLLRLVDVFEDFRKALGGKPLRIASAYRTRSWNRRCGGVSQSQHVQGRAIDILHPKHINSKSFREKAKIFAKNDPRVGGLGWYRWGVHIDVRTRRKNRLAFWNFVKPGTKLHDNPTKRKNSF